MYKQAILLGLMFTTTKGQLTLTQVATLSVKELDETAMNLQDAYDASGKSKSFLTKRTSKDKLLKLQLDIVVDILNTRVEEQEATETRKANKERNKEILAIIADKEKQALTSKSLSSLRAMLVDED